MTTCRPYVGRFAPSPTGRLHMGSMVAALASWLDARSQGGTWLLRMEDLDPPREVPGAADDILRTLEAFGLTWDGEVTCQSQRHALYAEALETLKREGHAFGCICTRKDLASTSVNGLYPGTCKAGLPQGESPRSWRFDMPLEAQSWLDHGRGPSTVAGGEMGDFVLKRADGHWAYHLAVVVDDAAQDVTHVVRGADLWTSTAAHMALQHALNLRTPEYLHVPLVTNSQGQKLSKQTRAQPVSPSDATEVLAKALRVLGQPVPDLDKPKRMLQEAVASWDVSKLRGAQVS